MIIVLDAADLSTLTAEPRALARVLAVIEGSGLDCVALDPDGRLPDTLDMPVFTDLGAVVAHLDGAHDALMCVAADQAFLDADVALNAHAKFQARSVDILTQWEHCRIPVGVGVRIFRLETLRAAGQDSVAGVLRYVVENPMRFRVHYDDHEYVAADAAKLDSRRVFADGLAGADAAAPGLAGFLAFAASSADDLRYQAGPPTSITDARGMPAPFGFETSGGGEYPSYLMFDLTNRCNARCIHCPQSMGFDAADGTVFLDYETYKRTIDSAVGRSIGFVRITADGEPLLHPRVWDMLDYATEKGVGPVGLTTNGSALNDRNIERLLDSGTFMVDVSLDGFSQETYEIVRAGLSYDRIIGNTKRLIARRNETGAKLRVVVSFVKQAENVHEVDAFREHWSDLADDVLIREMISNVGINDIEGSSETLRIDRWACPHWFRRVVINYDSHLKACPIDWKNESVNVSLSEAGVQEQWDSSFYHRNRMQHLNDEISPDSLCHDCRDWQGTPWNLGYEKFVQKLKQGDV